ncbi:female protein-like isoform X2 [Engystomops pustulosus]|uniref:female protein-like isoform X2 n=1 Tax=Engystomops pustulosus TaxID=76066 RepID=UPI003AFAA885
MLCQREMKIPALLLMVITGCCAKENLQGASFLFSTTSDTSKVVLKPTITKPLENMTVCLETYTDKVEKSSLFKLVNGSRSQFNLVQLNGYYSIAIDQSVLYYKGSDETMTWKHICVSWKSSTGVIHFMVNGILFPRKVLRPGFLIDPLVSAVLGQKMDSGYSHGGTSFVGEIRKVNMWDRALPPEEMESMYITKWKRMRANIINWESVDYEVYGDVFLYKP